MAYRGDELVDAASRQLIKAAKDGDVAAMRAALANGSGSVDARDETGRTPLHWAVRDGHSECAELLLRAGADKEARNFSEYTPLIEAARCGNADCVAVLIRGGADLEARDGARGSTPLHCAAVEGAEAALRALLRAGANVDVRTRSASPFAPTDFPGGSTPLHLASRANSHACVEALLEAGASATARDDWDRLPADAAPTPELRSALMRGARTQAAQLLFSAAAQRKSPLAVRFAASRLYDRLVWRVVPRFAADA
jgi:ankyrin repeat protein